MTPVLCQCCDKNPATIHFTEIKDNTKQELHICEACANEQGLASGAAMPSVLANLMQMQSAVRQGNVGSTMQCPHCGITFDEFRTKGRFGCPHDYEVFEKAMVPLLEKIHGAQRHTGRLPRGRHTVDSDVADRLLRLRRELQECVRTENYEDAARIRDEIRNLERQEAEHASSGRTVSEEQGHGAR